MYLFDASAILNLIKRGKLYVFLNGSTLDLAVYEVINAVWKECYILRKIKQETALKLIELSSTLFTALNIYTIKGYEREVLDLALKEGITAYDASYIYIATANKLTLVTDDNKLAEIANKYTNTVSTAKIAL